MEYYTVIVPVNGKPYIQKYEKINNSHGYQISPINIGITSIDKNVKLGVYINSDIQSMLNYTPAYAEIYENDTFDRGSINGLCIQDAEYILSQLINREYYLWNKPPQ